MKKLLLITLFILSIGTYSQPPHEGGWKPGDGKPPRNCFPPPCVPIDDYLPILFFACAIYGYKQIKK